MFFPKMSCHTNDIQNPYNYNLRMLPLFSRLKNKIKISTVENVKFTLHPLETGPCIENLTFNTHYACLDYKNGSKFWVILDQFR